MTSRTAHLPRVLTAAFAVSALHTIWTWVTGTSFAPVSPRSVALSGAFYVIGFATAALSRRRTRAARLVVVAVVVLFLVVAVAVYPTQFGPEQQTLLGWLEYDAYVGLLAVALYLAATDLLGLRRAERSRRRVASPSADLGGPRPTVGLEQRLRLRSRR